MICANCGTDGARLWHISRSYGKGDPLLVIENVPVVTGPACGESHLAAATLHTVERIKRERRRLAPTRPVAVADFA